MAEEKQQGQEQKVTLTGPQLVQLAGQERQRLDLASRRLESIQGFRTELMGAKEALQEIGKNESGNKILVNLGAGIYIEAGVEDNSKALVAIAGSVFREKKNEELIKLIGQRISEATKQLENAMAEQQGIIARVNQLEGILQTGQQMIAKQQREQQNQR